jgi:hypothetical protein
MEAIAKDGAAEIAPSRTRRDDVREAAIALAPGAAARIRSMRCSNASSTAS